MYLFSFLWNEILVIIFNMVILLQRLAIHFVEMHCTRTHPGNNCVLFTNRHVSAIKRNNYSIFIPIVAIWLWGLRNNYIFYNLLQFYTDFLQWNETIPTLFSRVRIRSTVYIFVTVSITSLYNGGLKYYKNATTWVLINAFSSKTRLSLIDRMTKHKN